MSAQEVVAEEALDQRRAEMYVECSNKGSDKGLCRMFGGYWCVRECVRTCWCVVGTELVCLCDFVCCGHVPFPGDLSCQFLGKCISTLYPLELQEARLDFAAGLIRGFNAPFLSDSG